eukprot:IDg6907t1
MESHRSRHLEDEFNNLFDVQEFKIPYACTEMEAMQCRPITKSRWKIAGFDAAHIYSVEESSLLFQIGPSRLFVLLRRRTCNFFVVSTFQKRKERLKTVFAVSCTGSHILPMRYIGKSKMPRSFRNYPDMKEKYSSQRSGWMDTK